MTTRKLHKIKRWKKIQYDKNPCCHWCGTKMILGEKQQNDISYRQPLNLATRDHLIHKFDADQTEREKPENWVLACYKCNSSRSSVTAGKSRIGFNFLKGCGVFVRKTVNSVNIKYTLNFSWKYKPYVFLLVLPK